jgi:hypothetical protein
LYDLQNLGLKVHNFSLELKQSKTPPAASGWIISTLVRRYVFFNPRFCKSWDCPSISNSKNCIQHHSQVSQITRFQNPKTHRKVASSRPVYYSILNPFGQRSQYISIRFPLHKQSENPWVCYQPRQSTVHDFTVFMDYF